MTGRIQSLLRSGWRGCRVPVALVVGLLALLPMAAAETGAVSKEYRLKAAFLYHFTKFVEWPPERFATTESPVIIGVLGHNPFGNVLAETVQGRLVNGRAVRVVQLATVSEARSAHVVFVSNESAALCDELERADSAGVLTVAEFEDARRCGAVIHFRTVGDKVRFEIDVGAAEENRLKLSAHLQKLAMAVHRPNSE